jgi:hypothetical protein
MPRPRSATFAKRDRETAQALKAERKQERRERRNRERAQQHAEAIAAAAPGMVRCAGLGCDTRVASARGGDGLCGSCRARGLAG